MTSAFLNSGMKSVQDDPFVSISYLKRSASIWIARRILEMASLRKTSVDAVLDELYLPNSAPLFKYLVVPNALEQENPLILPIERNNADVDRTLQKEHVSFDYRLDDSLESGELERRCREWNRVVNSKNILREGFVVRQPSRETVDFYISLVSGKLAA